MRQLKSHNSVVCFANAYHTAQRCHRVIQTVAETEKDMNQNYIFQTNLFISSLWIEWLTKELVHKRRHAHREDKNNNSLNGGGGSRKLRTPR
jgi:hypothetical protein